MSKDRATIPHNLEAEQSVLGAILLDPDSLLVAGDIIALEDFQRESHRIIYSACLDLYQDGDGIDLITLSDRLKAKGSLEQIGGITYLSNLANFLPTAANVRMHAQIVKNKSFHRRVIRQITSLKRQAEEDVIEDPVAFLRKIENAVIELEQTVKEKQDPHASAILSDIKKRWQEENEG